MAEATEIGFSQFWRRGVQDRGAGPFTALPGSQTALRLLRPHRWEERAEPALLSPISSRGLHLQDRITSQRPRLEIASHWGLGLQPVDLGGRGEGVMPTRSPARSPCPLIPGPLPEGDKREPRVPSAALCPGRAPAPAPHTPGSWLSCSPGAPERELTLLGNEDLSHSLFPPEFLFSG